MPLNIYHYRRDTKATWKRSNFAMGVTYYEGKSLSGDPILLMDKKSGERWFEKTIKHKTLLKFWISTPCPEDYEHDDPGLDYPTISFSYDIALNKNGRPDYSYCFYDEDKSYLLPFRSSNLALKTYNENSIELDHEVREQWASINDGRHLVPLFRSVPYLSIKADEEKGKLIITDLTKGQQFADPDWDWSSLSVDLRDPRKFEYHKTEEEEAA